MHPSPDVARSSKQGPYSSCDAETLPQLSDTAQGASASIPAASGAGLFWGAICCQACYPAKLVRVPAVGSCAGSNDAGCCCAARCSSLWHTRLSGTAPPAWQYMRLQAAAGICPGQQHHWCMAVASPIPSHHVAECNSQSILHTGHAYIAARISTLHVGVPATAKMASGLPATLFSSTVAADLVCATLGG
jgi:hypothetical protein